MILPGRKKLKSDNTAIIYIKWEVPNFDDYISNKFV